VGNLGDIETLNGVFAIVCAAAVPKFNPIKNSMNWKTSAVYGKREGIWYVVEFLEEMFA